MYNSPKIQPLYPPGTKIPKQNSTNKPKMIQTTLALRNAPKRIGENNTMKYTKKPTYNEQAISKPKTEFILMPLPRPKENNPPKTQNIQQQTIAHSLKNGKQENHSTAKSGRDLVLLMGCIDYCVKLHKQKPNLNALWDVYGKLLKISQGVRENEKLLLLRNLDGKGAVLQCVYYNNYHRANEKENQLSIGIGLRITGRFVGEQHLCVYKLQQFEEDNNNLMTHLTKIQEVNALALLKL